MWKCSFDTAESASQALMFYAKVLLNPCVHGIPLVKSSKEDGFRFVRETIGHWWIPPPHHHHHHHTHTHTHIASNAGLFFVLVQTNG